MSLEEAKHKIKKLDAWGDFVRRTVVLGVFNDFEKQLLELKKGAEQRKERHDPKAWGFGYFCGCIDTLNQILEQKALGEEASQQ